MTSLDHASLCTLGLTFVRADPNGSVTQAGGQWAENFAHGNRLGDGLFLFSGMEELFPLIATGQEPALAWPNVHLPAEFVRAASQHDEGQPLIADVWLGPHEGALLLTLQLRGDAASADQETMQARNDLLLTQGQLRRAQESAELASRAKSQLMVLLREKMRAPLSNLVTGLRTLSADMAGLDAHAQAACHALEGEGKGLLTLLDELLDLATGDQGVRAQFIQALSQDQVLRHLKNSIYERAETQAAFTLGLVFAGAEQAKRAEPEARILLDPQQFQRLITLISGRLVRAGAQFLSWHGLEVNLGSGEAVLRLSAHGVDGVHQDCFCAPHTHLQVGAPEAMRSQDPEAAAELMLIALLLVSTGLVMRAGDDGRSFALALPLYHPAEPDEASSDAR